MRIHSMVFSFVVWLFAAFPCISQAQVSDQNVQDVIDAHQTQQRALLASGTATIDDVRDLEFHTLESLDLSVLTPRQLGMLYVNRLLNNGTTRIAAAERTNELVREQDLTVQGAVVRILRLALVGGVTQGGPEPDPGLQSMLLADALHHPALSEAIRSGEAYFVLDAVRSISRESVWHPFKNELYALGEDIVNCKDYRIAFDFDEYFELLGSISDANDVAHRQEIRAELVAYGRAVQSRAASGDTDIDVSRSDYLEDELAWLESPHAKGTFIGSQAPMLDFVWCSDEHLDSLAALKGQVVVLDFWATWCGPCVSTIPDIRKLQQRYEGYPVKIIGVTSLQGKHYDTMGVIDCAGDPEQEHTCMQDYITTMEITWTIAFSKQDVYNADYAVRGIPHVTIIDPNGTVRFNGLHPAEPLEDKAVKIDAILKAFGLDAPEPLSLLNETPEVER